MIGTTSKDIGKATRKPMVNPRIHLSKKVGTKPKLMRVRMKDIENDIDNAIKNPNKSVEYFLFIFMINALLAYLILPLDYYSSLKYSFLPLLFSST